jgi:DNA-binding IclR family transcriptional regulator
VGGRLPLSSTGVGKTLLAFSDPDVVDQVLSRPLRRLTDHSIRDPQLLYRELAGIRADGLGYDRDEAALGVSCLAAPVFAGADVVAALSVAVPSAQFDPTRLAAAVRSTSRALSRRLSSAR